MENFEKINLEECIVSGGGTCTEYTTYKGATGSDIYEDGKVTVVHKT